MTRFTTATHAPRSAPRTISSLPFAATVDVVPTTVDATEPSPCLTTAYSTWFEIEPERQGALRVDLSGSTPPDAIVRIYRDVGGGRLAFLGCASRIWNDQTALVLTVTEVESLLIQVGTSASNTGRLVLLVELE